MASVEKPSLQKSNTLTSQPAFRHIRRFFRIHFTLFLQSLAIVCSSNPFPFDFATQKDGFFLAALYLLCII